MSKIKKCKCDNHTPVFVENNPSNVFLICKECGRRTNGCNDKEHAVFCWNNDFVFTTH